MDWIKKNYALFSLASLVLVLLGVSAVLVLNARGFNEIFASMQGSVQQNNKLPQVDQTVIETANVGVLNPKLWSSKEGNGLLLVSRKYIVKDDKLVNPLEKNGVLLHPPVPNEWFEAQKPVLDILDNDILNQDPDKDGFSNFDEWVGLDSSAPGSKSTNPGDSSSHPDYVTKLKLKQFIKKPFRLLFNAYDGDSAHPAAMSFQINTVDVRQPTQFPKLNDTIAGTKFRIIKFTARKNTDANAIEHDISELLIEHNETKDQVTLILEKIVDSPDSYARFKYAWDGTEMVVKKEKTFSLKPEVDVQYKLIDIQDREATIENLKTGTRLKISRATE